MQVLNSHRKSGTLCSGRATCCWQSLEASIVLHACYGKLGAYKQSLVALNPSRGVIFTICLLQSQALLTLLLCPLHERHMFSWSSHTAFGLLEYVCPVLSCSPPCCTTLPFPRLTKWPLLRVEGLVHAAAE